MVMCAIVGCSKSSKKKGTSFFRIPSRIKGQGERTLELSSARRACWLSRIGREDLTDLDVKPDTRVCGSHFIQGKPSALYDEKNPDWAPSLALGHNLGTKRNASNRHQRSRGTKRSKLSSPVTKTKRIKLSPFVTVPAVVSDSYDEENSFILPDIALPSVTTEHSLDVPFEATSHVSDQPSNVSDNSNIELKTELPIEIVVEVDNICHDSDEYDQIENQLVHSATQTEITNVFDKPCAAISNVSDNSNVELNVEKTELLSEFVVEVENICDESDEIEKQPVHSETQTEMTMNYITNLGDECNNRDHELYCLREQLCRVEITEESFKHNDQKVKFYTGLTNFSLMMTLFHFLADHVASSHRNRISKFQEYLIFLMRLRLNLEEQDLAYRFNVSQPTISRILDRWLEVMYVRFQGLVQWPDRDKLQEKIKTSFKKASGKNVAIVDCPEIDTLRRNYKIIQATMPLKSLLCRAGQDASTTDKIVFVCRALSNLTKNIILLISKPHTQTLGQTKL